MTSTPKLLDATYRARALPPGTARHLSWLFASPELRAPLLGIYALGAEWQALTDTATEAGVARLKLAWWREEMQRLAAGSAVHPISRYLAELPRAAAVGFDPLLDAVDAAAAQVSGVPLEHGSGLEPHSQALWGAPLALASRLAADVPGEANVELCTRPLAAAMYLARAIRDYRREARAGRVPFAVDELLAEGVENADLAAELPPPHLQSYLGRQRERAMQLFDSAAGALARGERSRQRHLLVLGALGRAHLERAAPLKRHPLKDMILAWNAARRAR